MPRWQVSVVAVVAFALYAGTFSHGYALDDRIVIVENAFTQAGLAGIPDLLTTDSFRGFLGRDVEELVGGRYRPLSLVTFAVERALFGPSPRVGHLGNAMLYALCCVLLLIVLDRMLRERRSPLPWLPLPFAAALLFALHPVHSEVVANIKGRDEILALTGALASLWLGLRALDQQRGRLALASGALFFLALLAKENAITYLAVIPLALWFFRPGALAAAKRLLPPLLAAAALFLWLRQSMVGRGTGPAELLNDAFLGASLGERLATLAYTQLLYAKLLVWPHPLTYDYGPYHVPLLDWSDWRAGLALTLLIALGAVVLTGWRARRLPAFAIAYYAVTLSVASNAFFPIGTFMGERFLFMPSLGACLLGGHALVEWLPQRLGGSVGAGRIAGLALGIVAAAFAVASVTRAAVWRDDFTLTTTDVVTSAQSASANANAADQLTLRARETRDPAERDRLVARAVSHLEKALRIHPRYQRAWAILATTQRELRGDLDATLDVYERRFAVDPRGHDAAFNLGTLLLDRRPARRAEAIGYLELAAELRPDDPDPLANLAVGYYRAGETRQAIATLERALRLAPSRLDLHRNLAELLREIGDDAKLEREREAIDALEARVAPGA